MGLPKAYEPQKHEQQIYELWEKSGVFTPRRTPRKDSFSIMMPLPNANGRLHLGSVLFVTLQDIVTRYQRMKGKATLWLPGADHAGFETWVVYERELEKQGKSRFDFTREELYQQVWDFVAGFRKTFEDQFRQLGASCDWSRFTFSLDDKIVRQVHETFKKLWDDGLIYRGERIVNYCTFHGTSFADIEVVYKEVEGQLWHIRYPLTDGSGEIVVATTRPETMLGDVAVAVSLKDKRFRGFIGKTVKLPLTNREIPIVGDDFVEIEFGTGAVKLTPAHDPVDFEAAERHDLPMISVIDHEGKMTSEVPEAYRGLPVKEARQKVVADLEKLGLIAKVEDYKHSVGHCYKCGNVIQPLLRDQWFMAMKPLAGEATEVLSSQKIKFYPDSKRKQLIKYLEGLRDWNISRQIPWGIPIPAFQNVEDPDDWIFDERVGEETVAISGKTYRRDPDVFDTWFSSSQWPFATLGIGSQDFKQFYPTSLMETGGEILYPWVSRMITLGLYMTKEIPFEEVYIHGYVLAADGAKMSKSIGNVTDPDDMRLKYGADALRLGIIDGRPPAINRPFDESKAVVGRNFANKLWNIARYIEGVVDQNNRGKMVPVAPADHWILNKLSISADAINDDLAKYKFHEAYDELYHFVWDDLADWCVEASKVELNREVLAEVLQSSLKLAHPFAPFVTETIWQSLGWQPDTLLISQLWPTFAKASVGEAEKFEKLKAVVSEVRRVSAALEEQGMKLYFKDTDELAQNAKLVAALARLKKVEKAPENFSGGLKLVNAPYDAWLDISPAKLQQYLSKLQEEKRQKEQSVKQLEDRLGSKDYVAKAPKELVDETKSQLAQEQKHLAEINSELHALK